MTDCAIDNSSEYEAFQPRKAGNGLRRASWFFGSALIAWGVLGLSTDGSLYEFDAACLWVGMLAIPPVTDLLRKVMPVDRRAHAWGGALCVMACFGWAMVAPPERTAAHFTALQAKGGAVVDRWRQLPEAAADEQALAQADTSATKDVFLAKLASETAALKAGVQPASFIGDRATVMRGAASLSNWRTLVTQGASLQLSPEEAAQLKTFQDLAAAQNAALGPALRQSYAVSLRDQLAGFGVTAHVIGAKAETIEFNGAPLADPSIESKLRALLGKDMATLGYKTIQFVAGAPDAQAAAAEPQRSAALEAKFTPASAPSL